ncbi:hypothetical protein BVG19_g625 [[Candida] boidinii]|nr:hypothetical protein BVG19_g625 [[Candida] boidinii]OWB54108.1 hypothetical protein B5S27_g5744 [[Candida] boidinii]
MVTEKQIPPENLDFLTYSSYPSGKHKGKTHYIIVGAGIIGVCIAFYLTRHPKFDPEKHYITIVESKRVAGGASGKAGGLLALWAFPQQIVPLSFQLHQDLSNEFNGEDEWGYRRLTTISVEGDISKSNLNPMNLLKNHNNTINTDDLTTTDSDNKRNSISSPESNSTHTSYTTDDNENDNEKEDTTKKQISKAQIEPSSSSSSSTVTDKLNEEKQQSQEKSQESSEKTIKSAPPKRNPSKSLIYDTPISINTSESKDEQKDQSGSHSTTIKKNSIKMESSNSTQSPGLPDELTWINKDIINTWNHLGNESTTAQVHPYQFTTFILKQCIATGCVELVIGKVDDIIMDEETGQCNGVLYYPSSAKASYNNESNTRLELNGDKVIMSIGPWTSKILPDCPISGLRAHSITIKPENLNEITPFAIFTELKLNKSKFVSPEMYARKDEVYVCGEGDSSVLIPETTDDVEIVAEKCDELFNYVSQISNVLKNGKVLKRQACYLPVLDIPSSSGPLIGETNVENLYLASGHSCWGINNAPATGLLISEMLLDGEAHSCDISALDPSLYFDASLVYDDEEYYDEEDEENEEGNDSYESADDDQE